MSGWRACVLAAICATNCTKANPGATCTNGTCTDPAFPYCDSDGSVGGTAGECIAVSCTPGEIKECQGSQAFTCNATGDGYELDDCALGCADGPPPHCKYVQPTYIPDICDAAATSSPFVVTSSGQFDPNLDTNCTGGVVNQAGASAICIVRAPTIDIGSDATLTILGSASMTARAIAFVADDLLSVEGTIDVSGHTSVNGPGGGIVTSGGPPTIIAAGSNNNAFLGGGGAGGATSGGAGGETINGGAGITGGASNGGAVAQNPALSPALVGGASSAVVMVDQPTMSLMFTVFGGGGGALMLVSCHASVTVTGMLISSGGGGPGATITDLSRLSGFGGGAGGNIVIEGANVSVTGSAFANGGGGGGGNFGSAVFARGSDGEDGTASDSVAAAGGVLGDAGAGGSGAIAGRAAQSGGGATNSAGDAGTSGGGAGGVGFLQTYTPAGITPTLTPAHASPAFQPNGTVETR